MTAAGLIFSNIHDNSVPELTRFRTIASVPFGGRYRLIDFALSNMVNSGISKVGIVTHYNYQSLIDHLGNGKDWDLARRSGGIKLLPPYITAYENGAAARLYKSRLEAVMSAVGYISHCTEDYFVLSDCDVICNIDLSKVIADHAKSGADITFVTKKLDMSKVVLAEEVSAIRKDETGRITDFTIEHPSDGVREICTNIMVMSRAYLMNVIADATAHGYTSFFKDIISKTLKTAVYKAYELDGWYGYIGSMEGYFHCSMKLLSDDVRKGLFGIPDRPILTKVRNTAPTRYCEGASVSDSVIADGCIIEGRVENSILFRGVKVGRGCVVKNSIVMQDTYLGSDVSLNCVITDKNVVIKDGRNFSGHEKLPFFIGKNTHI